MTYRPGDYWLTDDRTESFVRLSDVVVEAETGFVVARGTDDPKHPLEARLRPRKAYAPRLVRPEPADPTDINPMSYGAVPVWNDDDTIDSTTELQAAFTAAAGKTIRIDNHYRVNATGITVLGGTNVVFGTNGKISLMPHNATSYEILRIHDVTTAVTVTGAVIDGRKDLNRATTGESGMGISIRSCTGKVTLRDPYTINCWGDGIYIGETAPGLLPNEDIEIYDHYASGCRRQGMSVITAKRLIVDSPVWENISGTSPQFGLDIEPNRDNNRLDYIRIISPITRNNSGGGIAMVLGNFWAADKVLDVEISGHVDEGSRRAVSLDGRKWESGDSVTGGITFTDPIWRDNTLVPFTAAVWPADGPPIVLTRPTAINCLSDEGNAPFNVLRTSTDDGTFDIGNVEIVNPTIRQTSATIPRIFDIRDSSGGGGIVRDVTITDPVEINIGTSASTAIRGRFLGEGTISDTNGAWQEERSSSATITTLTVVHRILCTNSSTATFTLGTDFLDGNPVPQFEVAGTGEVRVAPPSGAAFVGQATNAYYKSTTLGSTLTIVSHGSSSFEVTAQTGTWTVV